MTNLIVTQERLIDMTILGENWTNAEIPLHILDLLNNMINFEEQVVAAEKDDGGSNFEEYEIKFSCDDSIFQQLKNIECSYHGAAIERNLIYDDKNMSLHKVDARLRIRTFEDIYSTNSTALITVKKPKPVNAEFGAREFEAEILLTGDEAANIAKTFEVNGLHVVSSYERVRHYIALEGLNAKFDVDLFPNIGRFVEVEGAEADVMKAAKLLNVDLTKTNPDPYDTIHSDWCLEQGIEEEDHIKFPSDIGLLVATERTLAKIWH